MIRCVHPGVAGTELEDIMSSNQIPSEQELADTLEDLTPEQLLLVFEKLCQLQLEDA